MDGKPHPAGTKRGNPHARSPAERWNEALLADGRPRPPYRALLNRLRRQTERDRKATEDSVEATLREMGVSFNVDHERTWGSRPWECDILPQVFTDAEWRTLRDGVAQRLRAFDLLLSDLYGPRRILREGILPARPILESRYYQLPAGGILPVRGHHLHLSGICLTRLPDGRLAVKTHYFSHASGISYMIQNRRAMIRSNPEIFSNMPIELIAEAPLRLLEQLRDLASGFDSDPTVVLLTPGTGSAAYSEHSLLARRMGVPLVQGNDLLVLDDKVFLKTITGLQRVEVVYSRLADPWIDPLVFRNDSLLGIPGIVHCIRKGTVAFINSLGSQLADDRALLAHADRIVSFYLSESPILPTLPTRWLGNIDEQSHVMENLERFTIRPCYGEGAVGGELIRPENRAQQRRTLETIAANPAGYVAQPRTEGAESIRYHNGREIPTIQDHIFFALKQGDNVDVIPGALTRTAMPGSTATSSEYGGGSKDTWILRPKTNGRNASARKPRIQDHALPAHRITSRIAEHFYWLGRYLERAYSLSYLISTVETLETEELNPTERKLYRPMWNRLLPPVESATGKSRSIATWQDRYRLVAERKHAGSVVSTIRGALQNADSLQDLLSAEAWTVLTQIRSRFKRIAYQHDKPRKVCERTTTRATADCVRLIPEFLGTARLTMLLDEGWRFCETGCLLERAIGTANASLQSATALAGQMPGRSLDPHATEIELSALLRFLGSRDAYRRVYQMRAAPAEVLDILWQHPDSPRSVARCLGKAAYHLGNCLGTNSEAGRESQGEITRFRDTLRAIHWGYFFKLRSPSQATPREKAWLAHFPGLPKRRDSALPALLQLLYEGTARMHEVISDSLLSHQSAIQRHNQPMLDGFQNDAV